LIEDVCRYIDESSDRLVEDLRRLVRQPSVAAQGLAMEECAQLVKEMMEEAGIMAELVRAPGAYPAVYGEAYSRGAEKTVLFYNHYDVQPPEPLELWRSPPFDAEVREGVIYGRGVGDNKGDLASRIRLVQLLLEREELPCNVKFLVEGEEEIGSVHLPEIVQSLGDRLRADGAVWENGEIDERGRPIITLGMKGIIYAELRVRTAGRDAHSSLAAAVANPAWRLAWALRELKAEDERILVPGWYEDVRPFTPRELELLEKQPFEEEEFKKDVGITEFLRGMTAEEAKRALVGNPTCNIAGINSGYTGPGSKTVLPAEAFAKLDLRLVPEQNASNLLERLKAYLASKGFSDIEVTPLGLEDPCRVDPDSEIVMVSAEAARETYGKEAVLAVSSPGTGPMYLIARNLGIPCTSVGVGHPLQYYHAPNENQRIDVYIQGTKWMARTLYRFASR